MAFHTKQDFLFDIDTTLMVEVFFRNRKSLDFDYLKSRQMRWYTSEIFQTNLAQGTGYATEISLLRTPGGLCKVRTGWRRMADGGWRMIKCGSKNADDKMRIEKCGWQNADGKLPMTLCRCMHATETGISSGLVGHIGPYADFTLLCRWQNPYQWGKINLRCFLKSYL